MPSIDYGPLKEGAVGKMKKWQRNMLHDILDGMLHDMSHGM